MAYNPFNIFRRNQKAIFAVITVFIMFTFVLSSGLGGGADFFDWLPQWLGKKGGKGEALCTIDGSRITQSQLSDPGRGLRYTRLMANRYMSLAAHQTADYLEQVARERVNNLSPEGKQIMTMINGDQMGLRQVRQNPGILQNPELVQMLRLAEPRVMLERIRAAAQYMIESPTMKTEDKEYARTKLAAILLEESAGTGEQYGNFAPNRTDRQEIDFILWQKKADQLGIRFTTDDVKKLVQREFYGYLQADTQVLIQKTIKQNMPAFTMDACLKALGEEFRVRTAQVAVFGEEFQGGRGDKTYGAFPLFSPPYEAFEFYREQCSPTTYAAIPIPAENLVAEVDRLIAEGKIARPTDAELKDLFDKYKDDEPNPGKETPGFKTPRRIRVEWVSVTGEEPYYPKEAEEKLKQEALQADLRAVIDVPLFGGIPALVANAHAFAVDPLTRQAYDEKVRKQIDTLRSSYNGPNLDLREVPPLESSIARPGNAGVAVTAVGGQLMGFGDPLAALTMTASGPFAYEMRDRAKAGVPAVLTMLGTMPRVTYKLFGIPVGKAIPAPVLPGSVFPSLMGGLAAYQMMLPKPLPVEAYRGELVKELIANRAKELARQDMGKFVTEVNKLSDNGKKQDKSAAQKFILEWIAKRGLAIRGNKTAMNEWTLEEDPDLAPLVTAQREAAAVIR